MSEPKDSMCSTWLVTNISISQLLYTRASRQKNWAVQTDRFIQPKQRCQYLELQNTYA